MFRRYFLPVLGSVALMAAMSILASAQSGALRGHVTLKQADGTVIPAADATIDVFRTDLPGDYTLKTNKKGEFIHVGLAYSGEYIVAASMPGARPDYLPSVKAGRDVDYALELLPGDGKRLTRDDIKTLTASGAAPTPAGAKESAEDRAKRAEMEKKNAEITASNEKAKNSNAIIEKAFKNGNEALKTKNYDLAISQYDEGLNADPDHPGAPALLTNKTMALNARGVDKYNAAVKSTDDAAKNAGIESAKKDWTEATKSSTRSVALLKAAPSSNVLGENANTKTNLYYALVARAEATKLYVTKVDQTKVDEGVTAFQEYITAEIDPIKKAKAQRDLANMLFDANVFDKALAEYQKILEANPDDLDALLRSGQALFNIGAINSDKLKYQDAANYLAKFVEKAPDTNPYKADAKAILDTLKDQANVKPEKLPAPGKRTKRP